MKRKYNSAITFSSIKVFALPDDKRLYLGLDGAGSAWTKIADQGEWAPTTTFWESFSSPEKKPIQQIEVVVGEIGVYFVAITTDWHLYKKYIPFGKDESECSWELVESPNILGQVVSMSFAILPEGIYYLILDGKGFSRGRLVPSDEAQKTWQPIGTA